MKKRHTAGREDWENVKFEMAREEAAYNNAAGGRRLPRIVVWAVIGLAIVLGALIFLGR